MGASDHWQYQGRQEHGWFGHGTAPDRAVLANQSVVRASIEDRVSDFVHGVIGALPASLRGRIEAQYQHETLPRLKEALTAWIRGARFEPDVFASRFLGRTGDDPVARDLHFAAGLAATATSHADKAEAAYKLADAIKGIGVDGWPRFVADAAERARDPATLAAIQASSQPPPHAPDAIRPVYPLEWAIAAATGGLTSGPGAAARILGGAVVRGACPRSAQQQRARQRRRLPPVRDLQARLLRQAHLLRHLSRIAPVSRPSPWRLTGRQSRDKSKPGMSPGRHRI